MRRNRHQEMAAAGLASKVIPGNVLYFAARTR
jgi:hypothetical protein